MKAFLSGNHSQEWRWDIRDFLTQHRIEYFDPVNFSPDRFSIVNDLKILESCDILIAYLAEWERQQLQTMLELSYASRLAKEVMVVTHIRRDIRYWTGMLPYSLTFSNLDGLKHHLIRANISANKQSRFLG